MKHLVMLSTATPGGMAQVVNSLRDGGLFETYRIRLIRTHDRGSVPYRLWLFLRALGEFFYLLATGQVSVVHAHVAMRGSFWRKSIFLWLARLFRRPTIVHLHGSQFEDFYEKECGPLRRSLVRSVFRQARAVVVLSEKWRAYIAAAEPEARVVIIHNFVDVPHVQAAIERIAAQRAGNVILFLGEIGQRKGIYDLVRAMPGILALCPDARLIAGGSGELEQVADCARGVGMEHAVSLPGWVAGEDKMRLLANAAVYVLPSHNENFPVSILEAMAAGLPVVSTPVGGIPDMIRNGEEGFLVEPGDTAKLAEAIGGLLAEPTRRLQMGESAQRRIRERFSAEDAIAAFSALYSESGAFVHDTRKTAVREA